MGLGDVFSRCGDAAAGCVDKVAVTLGPVLVTLCGLLITFVVSSYFLDVLPGLIYQLGFVYAYAITVLGLWLLFNLVFNYVCIMTVGPGYMPTINSEQRGLLVGDPELLPGKTVRWCRTCDKPKAMRAHHCSICNRCILKMDHHCPWVNNCVGYANLRYFNLFLFYMVTGTFFFLVASALGTGQHLLTRITSTRLLFATVLCFAGMVATALFLCWNIYLMVTNQSTIEFYGNQFGEDKRPNPYDLGVDRNLRELFGPQWSLLTLLLPSRRPPPGDGIIFPLRDDHETRGRNIKGWSQRAGGSDCLEV